MLTLQSPERGRRHVGRFVNNPAPAIAFENERFAVNRILRVEKPEPILLEHFGKFLSGPAKFILDRFNSGLLRGAEASKGRP